ncbi:hypothetical protein Tco_0840580 [Tanacetum coccineum]|uniref:Uncharacterized protein n=1 Tax=Tanacetum coccineum TaxID=301880 RepID=A0ABQ5AXH7_9ASTR
MLLCDLSREGSDDSLKSNRSKTFLSSAEAGSQPQAIPGCPNLRAGIWTTGLLEAYDPLDRSQLPISTEIFGTVKFGE